MGSPAQKGGGKEVKRLLLVSAVVLVATTGCKTEGVILYDLEGSQWVFPYFTYDQPTVLAFWNTDEAQCLKDFPALNSLSHRDGSVQLITVCTSEDRRLIEKWLDYERCSFDVVLDPGRKLARRLKVTSYPTYIYFDMNGKEIGRYLNVATIHNWFDKKRWIDRAHVD